MKKEDKRTSLTKRHHKPTLPDGEEALYYRASILDSISDAIITTDMAFVIVSWNRAAEDIYGWTADEVIGQPMSLVLPTDYVDTPREEILAHFAQHGSWSGDVIQTCKDGRQVHMMSSVNYVTDDTGRKVGTVGVNRNITARKQAEKALQESEDRFRILSELSSDYVISVVVEEDGTGRIEWVSESFTHNTGYTLEEYAAGARWKSTTHPDDLAFVAKRVQALYQTGQANTCEYRTVTKSGETRWIRDYAKPIWDEEQGRIMRIYGAVQDITERKQAEQALHDSEQKYRHLIENLHSGVVVHAPDTSILLFNGKATELLGIQGDQLLGKTSTDLEWHFIWADGSTMLLDEYPIHRVLDSQKPLENLEMGIKHHAADTVWVLVNVFPVFNEQQEIDHVVVTLVDITQRKQATDALRALKDFHETMIQSLAEGIVVTSQDGSIEYMNPAGAALLGYASEDMLGRSWMDIIPADQLEIVHDANARHRHDEAVGRYKLTLNHKNSSPLSVLVASSPRSGKFTDTGRVTSFIDISDLVRSQKALEDSHEFLQSTLDALSAHIAILDETGTIIAVNEAWRRFADANGGNDPTYGVGTNYLTLCETAFGSYSEEAPMVAAGIRGLLNQDGNGFHLDYPCHSPTELRWCNMRLDSFSVGNARRIVIAHYDITERKEAEEKEHQQRIVANTLVDVAAAINQLVDVDEVLDYIMKRIGHIVPHTSANFMLFDSEKGEATIVRNCDCYAKHGLPEPHLGEIIKVDEWPYLNSLVENAKPFTIADVSNDPVWVIIPDSEWIRAYACAPVRIGSKVIGIINVNSDTPGAFTAEHVNQLQALADQVAVAIHNVQLYQELESYSEFLERAVAERTTELQESEMRYRGIVEDQTELIHRFSLDGDLTFVNKAYCRYFDKSSEEIIGSHFMAPVPAEDQPDLERQIASLGPQNPIVTVEHRVIAADGEIGWIEWTKRMLFNAQGKGYQIQAVGRDITERKETEGQMRQTLAREMELNELKSRFVSMAAHDLRTPLAVIRTASDSLLIYSHKMSEEKKQDKFATIHTAIKNMVSLLDDILIVGRADAGKLQFSPEVVELETFCLSVLAEIQTSIGIDHTFDVDVTGDTTTRLIDPKLLRHILNNLLSNAIKYSPAGSTVSFELVCDEAQTVIRIRDEGIGIPKEDQTRLFETFHRAENVGPVPGTGLGLAIVKQAVDLHGGTITCKSVEGVGTTFTVLLPINHQDE